MIQMSFRSFAERFVGHGVWWSATWEIDGQKRLPTTSKGVPCSPFGRLIVLNLLIRSSHQLELCEICSIQY